MSNSVKITCEYTNTDFKRVYQFDGVADEHLNVVKSNIISLNSALAGDQGEGYQYKYSRTFVSDDADPNQDIGWLKQISKAEIITIHETKIPLF